MTRPVTRQSLEECLTLVAELILRDGPVYAPIFERLEREIAALDAQDNTIDRARRLIEARHGALQPNLAILS